MFRRAVLTAMAICFAVPLVLTAATEVAHADTLEITGTTTYTIDASTGVVHVSVDLQLRNLEACDASYLVYTGFSIPVPIGTSQPVATRDDGRVFDAALVKVSDTEDYLKLDVSFGGANLNCRRTWNVTVEYDLLGNAPRSQNPSRINPAYAGFVAFGFGDRATVQVIVPGAFESETFGDPVVETYEDGNTLYTAADIATPSEFDFFVSATNNDALVETDVTTDDGVEFVLRAWPGDVDWQEFITAQIEEGVPLLVELIGQPWPIDEPVEVRESYTPYLYGYAGWFSVGRKELEIGEQLDADTALHELSHAWFSSAWFDQRWLSEGFAQVFASKGVDALGGVASHPRTVSSTDPGKVVLNEWGDPSLTPGSEELEDVEYYGYNTSFFVIEQIAHELGDERLREVLDAVADDATAYRGDVAPESFVATTDWRRFLDLVEEIGGAQKAADLLESYVLTESQGSLLAERSAARDHYHELVADGGEWAAPIVVRERMADWNFSKAVELITAASAVLALRDELDVKVAELGTTYADDLEQLYESADEDLAESETAVLEQIETADALLAAAKAESEDDGLFGSIGLIGSDPGKTLDDAKAAFAAGDLDRARELAQDVKNQIAGAESAGIVRTLIATSLLLLIGLGAFLVIRRRKHRESTTVDEPTTTSTDGQAWGPPLS